MLPAPDSETGMHFPVVIVQGTGQGDTIDNAIRTIWIEPVHFADAGKKVSLSALINNTLDLLAFGFYLFQDIYKWIPCIY